MILEALISIQAPRLGWSSGVPVRPVAVSRSARRHTGRRGRVSRAREQDSACLLGGRPNHDHGLVTDHRVGVDARCGRPTGERKLEPPRVRTTALATRRSRAGWVRRSRTSRRRRPHVSPAGPIHRLGVR